MSGSILPINSLISKVHKMKKFIYIAVCIILITSLMPGINYSAPALLSEITLESPEAGPEMLREAEKVISKRLKAYGLSAFEAEIRSEAHQIVLRFRNPLEDEAALSLLASIGRLEFCEVFTRAEAFSVLDERDWGQWLATAAATDEMSAVLGAISPDNAPAFGNFVRSRQASGELPEGLKFAYGRTPDEEGNLELFALRYGKGMTPLLDGFSVENSQADAQDNSETAVIRLTFNEEGSALWAQATKENMLRPIAIVLDGEVCFAPVVQAEITSGKAMITGQFSKEEARLAAALIQGGELPVPLRVKSIKQ